MTERYNPSPERLKRTFGYLFPHSNYDDVSPKPSLMSHVLFFTEIMWSYWGAEMMKAHAAQGERYIHKISFSHLDRMQIDFFTDIVTPVAPSIHPFFTSILRDLRDKLEPTEIFGGFGNVAIENNIEMTVIGVEKDEKPSAVLWVTKGVDLPGRFLIPAHTAIA